ncbi:MAG: EamA family transporter, partial [Sneathiella sp.]
DEKLTFHKFAGVVVGLAGVILMMQPTLIDGLSLESYGQLAILAAALSYGFAGIWGKRLKATSASVNAFGMLVCSAITMLPLIFIAEQPLSLMPNIQSLSAIFALALLSTAVAYILYFQILAAAGAVNLLLVTFLIPISALLLGVGILGETVHLMVLYGMITIFAGLALIDGRILSILRLGAKN